MTSIGRRGILRGLAASALAAPLAQLLEMRSGRTAPNGVVPKVVFFYTPCGVVPDLWHPSQTGKDFTLPKLSAPLAPHQADCIFMDGVSMYPLNDHQGGSQQLFHAGSGGRIVARQHHRHARFGARRQRASQD